MARNELTVFSDLDRLLGRPFFGSGLRWPSRTAGEMLGFVPEVDVFERDGTLVTKVDLPGMKKEEVKVEVAEGHLAISGERKNETEERKDNVYRAERSYGSFYRSIPLPAGVKPEDVKASFSNGVLEVSVPLPARGAAGPRQVEVHDTPPAK